MATNTDNKKAVHPPVERTRRSVGTYLKGMASPIVSDPRGTLGVLEDRLRAASSNPPMAKAA